MVDAFLRAGDDDGDGRCNIGTGRETSVLDLARELGLRTRFAPARAGEVRRSCLDAAVAAQRLGWRARHDARGGPAAHAHQHGSRAASSSRGLRIAMNPAARAAGQNAPGASCVLDRRTPPCPPP